MKMINNRFLLRLTTIVLLFGIAFIGCDGKKSKSEFEAIDGKHEGSFILNNIPSEYNGMYAIFKGFSNDKSIYGFNSVTKNTNIYDLNMGQIQDGVLNLLFGILNLFRLMKTCVQLNILDI